MHRRAASLSTTAMRFVALAGVLVALWLAGAATGASAVESASATVSATQLRVDSTTVVHGGKVALQATAVRTGTTTALPGRTVRFRARQAGATTWTNLGTARTDASGRARITHTPKANTDYRADVLADARTVASTSSMRSVKVRPKVTLATSHTRVDLGSAAPNLSGTVAPDHTGAEVQLQAQRADGTWAVLSRHRLATGSRFAFKYRPETGGTKTLRLVLPAHDDHAAGASGKVSVNIRTYAFPVLPASAASYGRAHHDYPATDIFAACGTAVVSPTAGIVDEVSRKDLWDPKVNEGSTRGGLSVSIIGRDGVRYYGSHFATIPAAIQPGAKVATGQLLGTVGRTGSAQPTPCHLHFGISPPCGQGDWQVRRGVVPTWPYLDAWKVGTQRSPAKEIAAWRAANPKACPAA